MSGLSRKAGPTVDLAVAGRPGAYDTGAAAAERTVSSVLAAEARGFDAFVLGNFSDVGVREARERASIAVEGLGQSALAAAQTVGSPIGLVAVGSAGAGRPGILVEPGGFTPGELVAAFGDERLADIAIARFFEAADILQARGASALVPGGGVLMLLLDHKGITLAAGLPVVDGLAAVINAATGTAARNS